MTGARIEITLDDQAAQAALARVQEQLGPAGLALAFKDIGEYLVRATRERGEREVSPDGAAWDPLSPAYMRWKQRKRPGAKKLHFDFHMLGDQLSAQVDGDSLLVGTNAVYGAIHQFGGTISHAAFSRVRDKSVSPAHGTTIPARPWLGVSDEDGEEIVQIMQGYLRSALDAD
ncbi:MAG: phage virion morphogenesis protein [Proteobacteria bacterium]|nr:phage virion morphogenesis protein [Pseudomonadota bacterium]